ncbi:MAG: hypothetical protein LBP59_10080 [Planctomycetaceae bacterium]|jgi:hypothetical protein|nr:hypothetical protein [Planctomycetaceae bacterium]
MRRNILISTITSILFFVTIIGCGSDSHRPNDLPKLYSCKITVTQDGVPLPDASVNIIAKDISTKYKNASGMTDSNGVAEMLTHGFVGAPAGSYKLFAL